ncbi:hypothetical protein GORHZ_169_00070 [Gordonia rhizosphera NBRC 16068]|uniref:Uncharacterized protein n=1 Tax=Gordonia rhizosphera NBRC 16068 TaxID=1108045 RepID=K6WET8_9ACTN|nr:hypothetical protein [Gordonia rhizosphera]GAB92261.1 hypothetical protein GORHZ_169_00070 [Gordonia rhizosphera NBRC 16068]
MAVLEPKLTTIASVPSFRWGRAVCIVQKVANAPLSQLATTSLRAVFSMSPRVDVSALLTKMSKPPNSATVP